jgi:NAD(P)-dependent dehydrogenase (short-subunit alcohol dehydrogenase family)
MSAHICNYGLASIGMNSSKAAICQMTRSLACEWGPYKIRVNSLSPGYIASPIPKERYEKDPEALKVIEQQNPMGRISSPEEYRGAAVFMLSDASSFMTGSDLIIDGGISKVVFGSDDRSSSLVGLTK